MKLEKISKVPKADQILYKLIEERSTEQDDYTNISHRKVPTWAAHKAFIASNPYRYWFLINVGDVYIGSLSVTYNNEIGIVLFRSNRGRGFGTRAVRKLMDEYTPLKAIPSKRPGHWVANINPKNVPSIGLFEKLGARHIQNTYALET